ncbi:eCIS core domain-containing protein [Amycolatopsis sp. NPDC004747]
MTARERRPAPDGDATAAARTPERRGSLPVTLPTHGDAGSRAALVSQLQQAAGNARVQRLLASRAADDAGGTGAGLIVPDSAAGLEPGQMRRGPFLAALRGAAEEALAGADPVTQADARAHFAEVFGGIETQDCPGLERSLRENLPGAQITDAHSYVTSAAAAVRDRVGGSPAPAPGGLIGRLVSAVGSLASALFKARDGAAGDRDVRVVRGRLGAGQALDGGVRSDLESAYGRDFGGARVHTDARAGALAEELGARAFTVGEDIAFAPGEYRPGTLGGDALIAHELAHVQQQRDGAGGEGVDGLEEDADRAAVGAVVSRWSGSAQGLSDGLLPRLRAGLRLQRCAGAPTRPAGPQTSAQLTPDQWRAAVTAATHLPADQRGAAMTTLAQQALGGLGITVRQAGTGHPNQVHPDDYAETPTLNFDPRLNLKTRFGQSGGGRPIGDNVGYNFVVGGQRTGIRRYAIIGPSSLNPDTPLTTQQYAQHELSLVAATQPGPGQDANAQELRQWTEDFRGYFHQYAALPIPQRPPWAPLAGYYEQAGAADRQAAVRRLVEYYNGQPEAVQRAMRSWARRHPGTLTTDLTAALPTAP